MSINAAGTISVLIPTYNRAELLRRTLKSVVQQTRPADEIIVVDDGSTDETEAIVAAFNRAHGDPVRYLRQSHAGQSVARNYALRHASGDFLLFLDSDDLLLPDALEKLAYVLQSNGDAIVVYGRSQTIDADDRIIEPLWGVPDADGWIWERLIRGNFIRTPGLALIRRGAIAAVGGWNPTGLLYSSDDWELWIRLSEQGRFLRVCEPVLQYRVHNGNFSAQAIRQHGQAVILLRQERDRHCAQPKKYALAEKYLCRFAEKTFALYIPEMERYWQEGRYFRAVPIAVECLRVDPSHLIPLFVGYNCANIERAVCAQGSRLARWRDLIMAKLPRLGKIGLRSVRFVFPVYYLFPLKVRKRIRHAFGYFDP